MRSSGGHVWSLLVALTVCVGCADVEDSKDVRSGSIYAKFSVYNGLATATLLSGGANSNTTLTLSGGDRLVVVYKGQSTVMRKVECNTPCSEKISYEAELGAVYEAGATVNFALEREVETDVLGSSVVLPGYAVDLKVDPSPPLRRSAPFTVSWSPLAADDDVTLAIWNCPDTRIDQRLAKGVSRYEVAANTIKPGVESCALNIEVTAERAGIIDQALGGGRISAATKRFLSAETVP